MKLLKKSVQSHALFYLYLRFAMCALLQARGMRKCLRFGLIVQRGERKLHSVVIMYLCLYMSITFWRVLLCP
jgi:hypothetical protein